ncbi:ferredoxin [Streptacidiphilus fuscans]|uniref:Ferredoxin n=1 Tax=Streptacidiphilus fuscans TaxID=2789292 RepID=A0A931BBE6_9ACTN|nr:ferredoxin [Streptacidiphilus fuscans]MBF9073087.1 ferredoxin [Streptacidiphilus fuscans]
MGDRWHVEVDRAVCISSGFCAGSAPEAFRLDAARQSHPREDELDASESVLAAAESCPVEAILIQMAETGDPVFPD